MSPSDYRDVKDQTTKEPSTSLAPADRRFRIVGGGLGALLLLAVLGVGIVLSEGGKDPPPAPSPATVELSTPESGCRAARDILALIGDYERAAKWQQAADAAVIALDSADLCPGHRSALAAKAVHAGVEALFATSAATDPATQRQQVDRYVTLHRLAERYVVTFPLSNRQAAERARQGSWFLLSLRAWDDGLASGEISSGDLTFVRSYYSNLYDLGYWWTQPGATTRDEGMQLLATANAIDQRYMLGDGQGLGRLRQLLGEDGVARIAPLPCPLLPVSAPGDQPGASR